MTIQMVRQIIWQRMLYNTEEAKPYFTILGWVLIVAFTGFYFFNLKIASPQGYENFPLRIIITLFGIALILYKHWPKQLILKSPLIFHAILIFSFPFFFSYMLLKNPNSNIWQINELVGLVLLTFFVDWISFAVMTIIGLSIAIMLGYISNHSFELHNDLIGIFGSYSAPIIYFIIFSRKRKQLYEERNNYHNNIAELNNQLESKVNERTTELKKALAAKTEFLNNMSHEIRTPIQGITTVSEALIEHWLIFDDPKKFNLVEEIVKNSKRLVSLVSNLLDLAKINAGKMLLDLQRLNLVSIIIEIIDECKILYINEKPVEINFKQEQEVLFIGDRERITQVLRNLFFNAIKFSPVGGVITINLTKSQITYDDGIETEAIHFVIKDQGVGIPTDELQDIFTPFVQSSRTKTRAGGTGLGLAITREIIEAHHGKIWAENNVDQGAIFNFIVPVIQDKQMDGHSIIIEDSVESEHIAPLESANILIIDDEETCLTSMELLLFGSCYTLYKASSGYAGLEYLKTHYRSIDLILLDLMMPDIYGLNLLVEIKKDPALARIPIILQTGSSDNAEIERAFKLGSFSYINKPYQKHTVMAEIAKALRKE